MAPLFYLAAVSVALIQSLHNYLNYKTIFSKITSKPPASTFVLLHTFFFFTICWLTKSDNQLI